MSEHDDQYWEQIDDFLDKRLSPTEQAKFEEQLQQEEQLQKDVALQRNMRSGVAFGSQSELRNRLQLIQQEVLAEDSDGKVIPLNRGMGRLWLAAAGLLIGALTILFLIQSPNNPAELYASNYEPYTLKNVTRSPEQDSPLSLAIAAYNDGDYEAAVPRLKAALADSPDQAPLQLALAVSLWESGDQQAAIAALEPVLDHPLLQDQANWYAGLFQLKNGDVDQAKVYLKKAATGGGALGQQADALLEQLPE